MMTQSNESSEFEVVISKKTQYLVLDLIIAKIFHNRITVTYNLKKDKVIFKCLINEIINFNV